MKTIFDNQQKLKELRARKADAKNVRSALTDGSE